MHVRMYVHCMMPELARLLARSESSRDVLDYRLLLLNFYPQVSR